MQHVHLCLAYQLMLLLLFLYVSLISLSLYVGIQRIASLEAETTGLQIGSLFMNIEGYSIMESIVFLIFDSLLYYLLGRYFDQVIPKEYGLTQPWYFLFTKAYWRGEMVQTKHSPVDHSKDERYVIRI